MIERKMLEDMFAEMREHGVDTGQDLLWGYFFTDPDSDKLEAVIPHLEEDGFRFVELYEAVDEEDEDADPMYFLHIERVETHTIDSLHARNLALYAFAEQHGLESYDGMDVGLVDDTLVDEEEVDEP